MADRDAEIARRALLLRELEHRTKNNFALVVSLLNMQQRQQSDPQVIHALELATSRINSFARANANLAERQGEGGCVEMGPYLREVVTHFANGAFHAGIKVACKVTDCRLPREVAVGIGLFTNEALTNCAKYAFPDGSNGRVEVGFDCTGHGWVLVIEDDGVGEARAAAGSGDGTGLGNTLMRAFARQAQADYCLEASAAGRRLRLAAAD